MTCATTVNLCATRGLAWLVSIENIRDAAGAPVDLAGASLLMRIGRRGAAAHLLELTSGASQVLSPEPGAVVIDVAGDAMEVFPASQQVEEYVQSLLATTGGAQVPVWQGLLHVRTDPTQAWST